MRDIGALGWLSPVGKKIETKSETFKYKDNFGVWGAGTEWLEGKIRNRQSG